MTSFGRTSLSPTYSPRRSGDFRKFARAPLFNEQQASRVETETRRLYVPCDGSGVAYPSVTTILGDQPKPELDAWRAAVGEEEADKVSRRATLFGTRVHDLAERYLLGTLDPDEQLPDKRTQDAFTSVKSLLDSKVKGIYGTELMLYSHALGTAGTCDLPCLYAGAKTLNTIADFKTSNNVKHRQEIDGYFTQTTIYSMMLEELTGIRFDNMVIIMIVLDSDRPLVYEERRSERMDNEARRVCHEYHQKHNGGSRDYSRLLNGKSRDEAEDGQLASGVRRVESKTAR